MPSFDRQTAAQTAVIVLITGVALAALGSVAAYWTWEWLAPRSQARARSTDVGGDGGLAAASLFGLSGPSPGKTVPSGLSIKLLGLFTSPLAGRGYVILRTDSRQVLSVREGEEIAAGLRLAAVENDRIVVDRGGLKETIQWPEAAKNIDPFAKKIDQDAPVLSPAMGRKP